MKSFSRYRDIVEIDDVLGAMADSLMERQPKVFQPKLILQDVPSSSQRVSIKRPPREIFYRQTSMFLTNVSSTLEKHTCNIAYLCDGKSLATITCHSCSLYHPSMHAHFCKSCFARMHPWHRIPHVYTSIETNEDIDLSLRISHHIAESKRYEQEGQDILNKLHNQQSTLTLIAQNEHAMEDKVWDFGRRAVALEEHIYALQQQLHEDLYVQSLKKSLVNNHDEEFVQKQKEEQQRLKEKLENIVAVRAQSPPLQASSAPLYVLYHPEGGMGEGGDTKDGLEDEEDEGEGRAVQEGEGLESVGEKREGVNEEEKGVDEKKEESTILIITPQDTGILSHSAEVPPPPPSALPPSLPSLPFPSLITPQHSQAATNLNRIVRGYLARRVVSRLLGSRLFRVFSPQYGRDFFFDKVNQSSSWTPSKLLLSEDLEALPYLTEPSLSFKWPCKTSAKRRTTHLTFPLAVQVVQKFARCILARKKVLLKANGVYRRVLDEESGTWYYANIKTGGATWSKPSFFCSVEPPLLEGEKESKISPRTNRM